MLGFFKKCTKVLGRGIIDFYRYPRAWWEFMKTPPYPTLALGGLLPMCLAGMPFPYLWLNTGCIMIFVAGFQTYIWQAALPHTDKNSERTLYKLQKEIQPSIAEDGLNNAIGAHNTSYALTLCTLVVTTTCTTTAEVLLLMNLITDRDNQADTNRVFGALIGGAASSSGFAITALLANRATKIKESISEILKRRSLDNVSALADERKRREYYQNFADRHGCPPYENIPIEEKARPETTSYSPEENFQSPVLKSIQAMM